MDSSVLLLNAAHWTPRGFDEDALAAAARNPSVAIVDRIVPGSVQQQGVLRHLRQRGRSIKAVIAASGDDEATVLRRIAAVADQEVLIQEFMIEDHDGLGTERTRWALAALDFLPAYRCLPVELGRLTPGKSPAVGGADPSTVPAPSRWRVDHRFTLSASGSRVSPSDAGQRSRRGVTW